MKTVKKADVIQRVADDRATVMVSEGWSYCLKAEWKAKNAKPLPNAKPAEKTEKDDEKLTKQKGRRFSRNIDEDGNRPNHRFRQ